jgi:hypothetical protein
MMIFPPEVIGLTTLMIAVSSFCRAAPAIPLA